MHRATSMMQSYSFYTFL